MEVVLSKPSITGQLVPWRMVNWEDFYKLRRTSLVSAVATGL